MAFPSGWELSYNVGWPNTFAANASAGNRENLMDPIVILDPTDTPGLNMLPKEEWPAPYVEWLNDTLVATATAGWDEGAEWESKGLNKVVGSWITTRTRGKNQAQIQQIQFAVSRTQQQMSQRGITAGVRNEYQYQLFKAMKALMRSIDARIFANVTVTGLSGTSAASRITKALRGFGIIASSNGSAGGTFATAHYSAVRAAMDAAGADPDTMFVSTPTKVAISIGVLAGTLVPGANPTMASNTGLLRRFTADAYEKELSTIIDVMEDDFGRVVLIRDRWMPATAATAADVTGASAGYFLMDRSKVKIGFFQRPDHFPLPPNGDSQRGFVLAEWGTKVLHPSAVGCVYNVTDV